MLPRPNAVLFLGAAAGVDACSLWRLYKPHLSLPGSGFFAFTNKPDFPFVVSFSAVVVSRCFLKPQYEFLKFAISVGIKIIYDLDDDIWDIPKANMAYGILGPHKQGFKACMQLVDVITVSTQTLKKVVLRNVSNLINSRTGKAIPVIVCENRIFEPMCAPPAPLEEKEKVRIGWGGSDSHRGDMGAVMPALVAIAQEPNVEIEFRGGVIPNLPLAGMSNFTQEYWVPVAEYLARMPRWGWDVALAPVSDDPFNNSKSCIKMVEAAYCGIPCLASMMRPYEEFCHWDTELRYLLCAGTSAWSKKLRELVNDRARRLYLGERMRKVMSDHYSFNRPHEGWRAALNAAGVA